MASSRVPAIDALRGAVMMVMALDHTRDFIHAAAMSGSPEDLTQTTPFLFFTRWITHFCAPVFMFTAGLGAWFWWQRGRTKGELSRFLLTRGVWLILLEVTVMRVAFYFNFSMRYPVLLVVFWALGASMIILAGLVHLPMRVLAVLSVAVIVLHNLLDGMKLPVLHQVSVFKLAGLTVFAAYPLIPWFAVMAAGFCFGEVFRLEPERRQRIVLRTGLGMTLAFVLLRAVNVYGDPSPWSAQSSGIFTVLSFFRVTKYPPSLDFLLMTLGPALMLLWYFDRLRFSETNPLIVFGRVPLFYFLAHFYLARFAAVPLAWMRYGHADFVFQPLPNLGGPAKAFPPDFGFSLWVVYAVWIAVVASLYPVCRWYAGVKARRRDWWLSYL